jgi:hypothetical protein
LCRTGFLCFNFQSFATTLGVSTLPFNPRLIQWVNLENHHPLPKP